MSREQKGRQAILAPMTSRPDPAARSAAIGATEWRIRRVKAVILAVVARAAAPARAAA